MRKMWVAGAAAWIALNMTTPVFAGTWIQDPTKPANENGVSNWWYQNDDGTYPVGTWAWIDGNRDGIAESYCFNENGWMYSSVTGVTTTVDGYEINENGAWVSGGQVVTKNVGRSSSQSSSSSSSSSYNSSSYTSNSSTKKSGWVSDDYGKQYLDSEGEYITGWKKISGKQYYFDDDGYALTGYQDIDDVEYLFSDTGALIRQVTPTDSSVTNSNAGNGITPPNTSGESSNTSTKSTLSDDEAYEKIIALQASYPEGMLWTNDNSYHSGNRTGYGCAGFAFMVQDAVFGKGAKKTTLTTLNWDDLRVGDHLRVLGGGHSVIILSIDGDSITLCEGNYNSSIHWGRTMSQEELEEEFVYRETCY